MRHISSSLKHQYWHTWRQRFSHVSQNRHITPPPFERARPELHQGSINCLLNSLVFSSVHFSSSSSYASSSRVAIVTRPIFCLFSGYGYASKASKFTGVRRRTTCFRYGVLMVVIAFKSVGSLWWWPLPWLVQETWGCGVGIEDKERPASCWTIRTKSEYLRGRLSC